ncbi:hypothetical protein [Falsiroseomonas bella]|uniref:hypothetical protein n=1 Tax=Falsiroseomonas bella TaxID=2184016 RepID=UPI001304E205|nr:hypothetical protein [Falsiroseomonas bella]
MARLELVRFTAFRCVDLIDPAIGEDSFDRLPRVARWRPTSPCGWRPSSAAGPRASPR